MSCLVYPFILSPRPSSLLFSLPLFFLRFFSRLPVVTSPLVSPCLFVSLFFCALSLVRDFRTRTVWKTLHVDGGVLSMMTGFSLVAA